MSSPDDGLYELDKIMWWPNCVCVCVCVSGREGEREREDQLKKEVATNAFILFHTDLSEVESMHAHTHTNTHMYQ